MSTLPHTKNPRVASVKKLNINRESIRDNEDELADQLSMNVGKNGVIKHPILVVPILGGYRVLDGRKRVLAAIKLGIDIVPIKIVSEAECALRLHEILGPKFWKLERNPETILSSLESFIDVFGTDAAEIVDSQIEFLNHHNPELKAQYRSRAAELLRRCEIEPAEQ